MGREKELDRLAAGLTSAREGRGGLVMVAGEPGIGKTTVASALADRARDGGLAVAWGRCREDGETAPFGPWLQALGRLGRAPAGPVRSGAAPGEGDGPTDRFLLFETMVAELAERAGPGALVILDDLHRADEASLAFLRFLAPELQDLPVLLLGAYRPGEVGEDHPLRDALSAMADGGGLESLTLAGLAPGDLTTLVRHHAPEAADEVAALIVDRCGGNPFFAVEMARLVHGEAGPASSAAATAVPSTVRDVLVRRLDRLPDECRRALTAAAVLGRDFGQRPLAAMLGAPPLAVVAALQPAATTGLLTAEGRTGYRFTHALVPEAICAGLAPDELVVLHARAADVLADSGRDDDETVSALAFHRYRAAAGGAAGRALEAVLAAARRANRRLAFEEAARWFEAALELAPAAGAAPASVLDLSFEAAGAELAAGALDRARTHFEAAARLARSAGDAAALARAALGAGDTVVTAGRVDWPLVELLEEAEAAADPELRARLHSRRAIELYWHQGSEASRRESAAALGAAEASGSALALAEALRSRQFTLRAPGFLAERIGIGQRLVALAQDTDQAELAFMGSVWLAADLMRQGEMVSVRRLVGSQEAAAARSGRPLWRWYATVMGTLVASVEGRVAEAREGSEAVGQLGRRLGLDVAQAYRVGQQCVVWRETEGLAALADDIAAVRAALPYFVTTRGFVALAAATTGRPGEARAELDLLAPDRFAAVPRDSLWGATVALLLEAAALSGSAHTPVLLELLDPGRGTFVVQGLPNCWGSVDRFCGRARLALGDLDGAERDLARARQLEEGLGAPLFVARTTLDQARLALARGRRQAARDLAGAVEATAERLGLAALGAEAAGVDAEAGRGDLSARERQVLALVAAGASNKDVAAALVISLNTVERHLANIYAKLGVKGRAEAAVRAVQAGLLPSEKTGNGGLP